MLVATMATTLEGSCHCGNLAVDLRFEGAPEDLPIRACTCSFCLTRRARWTASPGGELVIEVRDLSALKRYRFGTGTADFLICAHCGIHVGAVCEIDSALYAVVNIDCFESLRDGAVAEPISFEGEAVGDRLARRKRSWMPARVI